MNTAPAPNLGERQISPELAFADVEAIESLRQAQYAAMDEASNGTAQAFDPDGLAKYHASRAQVAANFDGMCDSYLSQHISRDDNPEKYDVLSSLFKAVSAHNLGGPEGDTKWELGDKDADGNYIAGTSGVALVRKTLKDLSESSQPNPDGDPDDEPQIETMTDDEKLAALEELKSVRSELAKLSIERRRKLRKNGRKAKGLEAKFNATQDAYQKKCIALGVDQAVGLRNEGKTDDEIRAAIVGKTILERKAFTEAELNALQNDDTRRGRFARWLARGHHLIGFNVVSGVVAGFGISYGLRQVTKHAAVAVTAGVAAPVALGVGLAARSTRVLLGATINNRVTQHKRFDQRADDDIKALNSELEPNLTKSHDDDRALVHATNASLQDNISQRTEKDRKSNVRRVMLAAAISGGAAVAGAVGGEIVGEHFKLGSHSGSHKTPQVSQGHSNAGNGTPYRPNPGSHTPKPTSSLHPHHAGNSAGAATHPSSAPAGTYDGFNTATNVPNGGGYDVALQQLAAEKGIHLSGAQSWDAYQSVAAQNHGNFFVNDPSYLRVQGDYGISRPGAATWNTETINEFNEWLKANKLTPAA